METERLDCKWCGSARSIEHGICQVCLMEYPLDTKIIQLPLERSGSSSRSRRVRQTIDLTDSEVAEKV